MTLNVDAAQGSYLDIPRFNYPYYRINAETGSGSCHIESGVNNKIRLCFDGDYSGILNLEFHEAARWRIAEIISLISVIAIAAYSVFFKKKLKSA